MRACSGAAITVLTSLAPRIVSTIPILVEVARKRARRRRGCRVRRIRAVKRILRTCGAQSEGAVVALIWVVLAPVVWILFLVITAFIQSLRRLYKRQRRRGWRNNIVFYENRGSIRAMRPVSRSRNLTITCVTGVCCAVVRLITGIL